MGKLTRIAPVAALLGLGALIFFLRLHTYEEPLERDITTYAVIAHEMLNGKELYSDLWDHKPPAIHATYAAAELIAGYGRNSIFLMNVAAGIATMLACYFAGSAAGGGRLGGLVAATFWTLASGDLALNGNQPNTEVFLNSLLTAGFALFVSLKGPVLGWRRAILVGLLFAIASLYKQVVVMEASLLALAYFALAHKGFRKQAFVHAAIIGVTGAAIWGAVFLYFAAGGRLGAFWETVFVYNRWYSTYLRLNPDQIAIWWKIAPEILAVTLPMAALSATGLLVGLVVGPRRPWILLLALALGTHLAILLPGRSFPHYYQLWLPPLAIGAGWTIALLKRVLPARLSALSYGAAAASCAVLIMLEAPYYQLQAEDWSIQKYGDIFVKTERLAHAIDKMLPPGATFYEWGNETGFYFTSGRRPPSGLTFAYCPTLAGPFAAKLSQRLISDLQGTKPELVVVEAETLAHTPLGHPIRGWLQENYQPFSRTGPFLLLARHGSSLVAAAH